MEYVSQLHALQELDLSRNSLRTAGLASLGALAGGTLKYLSLAGNFLQHIPRALSKLTSLETLDLSGNNISQLKELHTLTGLLQMHSLTMQGNPVSALPHYREYALFVCRSVCTLDAREVSDGHRDAAVERFDKLDFKPDHLLSYRYRLVLKRRRVQAIPFSAQNRKPAFAGRARMTKQLLDKRSAEWAYTNERMTELEQEVAFYKIDHQTSGWDSIGENLAVASAGMAACRRIHCRVCIAKCCAVAGLVHCAEKDGISRGANDAGMTHESSPRGRVR